MSRFSIFITAVTLCAASFPCFAQLEIKVTSEGISCDSLKLQSYNWEKKSGTNLVIPFSQAATFKQKASIKPGMYWITADTNQLATILISPEKKQKISLSINPSGITFDKSPENTIYQQYLSKMSEFNKQRAALDKEYAEAQNLPAYMLRTLADSLTARAKRIQQARSEYEQKIIRENPKTLLASVVAANISLPEIPMNYYNNPPKIQEFIMQHFFDNFPWNDPRIFNTPVAENKFKEYVDFVYQIDRPELDTFVVEALKASSINATSHQLFFERLDKDLGYYMSNYKVEHTYIKMLQYILATTDLEKIRRTYYEYELSTINKNLNGSIAADFRFVNEKGDTSNLHSVQSEYTLLFLHNPTCSTCREVRRRIANYEWLNKAIASGRLNVLTVYMEKDEKVWKHYLENEANPSYMHAWNFDTSIEDNKLYETRTIPYMFLLDKDKRVIKKNILYNEIEDYIQYLKIY